MNKIIFWIVVVFAVLLGLRLLNTGKARRRTRERDKAAKAAAASGETMVRCGTCGVFLPQSEARPVASGYVCGDPTCGARR